MMMMMMMMAAAVVVVVVGNSYEVALLCNCGLMRPAVYV
jgi:hypothetical protein